MFTGSRVDERFTHNLLVRPSFSGRCAGTEASTGCEEMKVDGGSGARAGPPYPLLESVLGNVVPRVA